MPAVAVSSTVFTLVTDSAIRNARYNLPTMHKRTWLPAKPKRQPKPKLTDDVRQAVNARLPPIIAQLKQRYCKKPKNPRFNWPNDLFARWHRDALYVVVVMQTPHGRPPTFETHAARMEYAGDGKFNLAVPMRRGWNTIKSDATSEECLKEVSASLSF
jgi:hypothetical protein